jgi:hypothetical protein
MVAEVLPGRGQGGSARCRGQLFPAIVGLAAAAVRPALAVRPGSLAT